MSGVAYYTVERDGFRVVVTPAQRGGDATAPVRFEALLAPGQSVVLSAPRGAGIPPDAVEIGRHADAVLVRQAAAAVTNRAAQRPMQPRDRHGAGHATADRRAREATVSSRLSEAARDIASDSLAAVGTSLYMLGFIAAIHVLGFFDAIDAAALYYAAALNELPH